MAKRSPLFFPELDLCGAITIIDPHPATIEVLNQMDDHSHALATGWGYPMHVQSVFQETNDVDIIVQWVVPPAVQYASFGLCTGGHGSCVITSNATGDTTTLQWQHSSDGDTADTAKWVWTNTVVDDSAASAAGLALKVYASTTWLPKATSATLNPAALGTLTGTIYAVAIKPLHQVITL
mgnify:CR=1 FL=1